VTDAAPGDVIEISVVVDGETAEAICQLFERHGGGAVVEVRYRAGEEDGDDLAEPLTTTRTYIPARDVEARRRIEEGLWHLSRIHPIPEAALRTLAEANWAEAWRAHFTPQRIGRRFLVAPSWSEVDTDGADLVMRLDPGMAFGTGLHPTTRMCLAALEGLVTPGADVLDVGTGSGILAIGAALLGARRVVGLDIDPRAVETAAENARANGVTVELHAGALGNVAPGARFDVVVANILATTIRELAADLAARLKPSGTLVASGILDDQASAVSDALARAGLTTPDVTRHGDWVALTARAGEGSANHG
jgi:ribosomal protein L11 methyltransferase